MNDDDEYEYEYSTNETETFYVDLDLSSVNNVIKSKIAGDRKTLKRPQSSSIETPKKTKGKSKDRQDQDNNQERDDEDDDQAEAATPIRGDEDDEDDEEGDKDTETGADGSGDSVQILELHSANPIVSYRNQIYSCQWVDMIGTTMFFTKHNETPLHEPTIATEDYDLIGTSRIKLVGHRAKVTARSNTQQIRQPDSGNTGTRNTTTAGDVGNTETIVIEDDDNEDEGHIISGLVSSKNNAGNQDSIANYIPSTYNASSLKRTDPEARSYAKRQANFLERLRDIKRSRGEKDTVRTFVDRHTLEAEEKKRRQTMQTREEIDLLNARVIKGDTKALARLQEIYSHIDEVESEAENEGPSHVIPSPNVTVTAKATNSGGGEVTEQT